MARSIAFVTYNTVGDSLSSGWHESGDRRALVLQNTYGLKWGSDAVLGREARNLADVVLSQAERVATGASHLRGEIGNLWEQLQQALLELDHVVVYVGNRGSEYVIELAAQLPADKVTFVACDCGLTYKEALIERAGLAASELVLSECGGHRAMRRLFNSFMATGELRARVPA